MIFNKQIKTSKKHINNIIRERERKKEKDKEKSEIKRKEKDTKLPISDPNRTHIELVYTIL